MGAMDRKEERCILCQTPVSSHSVRGDRGQFCCSGCEKVFEILSHLDSDAKSAYVATAERLGIIPATNAASPFRPDKMFPVEKATPSTTDITDALRTERLQVDGLVCPSCSWVSGEVLKSCNGVRSASVNYFTGTAEITFDMTETSVDDLAETLRPLGYTLSRLKDGNSASVSRSATYQFVITAILAMNVMSLSVLRYFHTLGYLESVPGFIPWLEGALVLPILYIGWLPTARRALAALRYGRPTMDLLIALGVFAAAILSYISLFLGLSDMYFETCAGLVSISLMSRMIEARLRDSAFFELRHIMKMPVVRVRRRTTDGGEEYVHITNIEHGDKVRFLSGETVPVDGEVTGDGAVVSEAQLTGEPSPLSKRPGDTVTAGSSVLEGILDLRVLRRFDETLLSRIALRIGTVLSSRETHLRQADRIAAVFIPAVLLVAVLAWIARITLFGFDFALSPAGWFPSVAILAVACPCAFSLAGISAVTAAVGMLLKKGFLVNEVNILEVLPKINHVIFDKTGTLTQGSMSVDQLVFEDAQDAVLLQAVRVAEASAAHPAAEAIRARLSEMGIAASPNETATVTDLPGGRAAVFSDRTLTVGNASLFNNPFTPQGLSPAHTAVWFGWDRRASGCFLLTDKIKAHAKETVSDVKALGMTCALLSGDRSEVARFVAAEVGIDTATGGASIEDKIAVVDAECKKGKFVAYVGDGTNDAEAMSRAHVSIAPAKSTDEALSAAGLIALRGDIAHLSEVFTLGRKLAGISKQNYFWAFAFNTLFIPVAALGKLVPLAAMLLMLLSSGAVLLNSTRLKRQ